MSRPAFGNQEYVHEKYGFHPVIGFLKIEPPILRNPEWNNLVTRLPEILANPEPTQRRALLEEELEKLPEFDTSLMEGDDEKLFGLRDLAFVFNALIHSSDRKPGDNCVPEKLANPMMQLSEELGGIPPLMSYLFYVRCNVNPYVRHSDPVTISTQAAYTFTSGYAPEVLTKLLHEEGVSVGKKHNDESHFVRIHHGVELTSVNLVNSILKLLALSPETINADNKIEIQNTLKEMTDSLKKMRSDLLLMYPGTGFEAFNKFRQYLKGTKDFANTDGKIGIYSPDGKCVSNHVGGSGAQTPLFQIIDAFLGVDDGKFAEFYKEQKEFFLPKEREFIDHIKQHSPKVMEVIRSDKDLSKELGILNRELYAYRMSHLRMVTNYIGGKIGNGGTEPSKVLLDKASAVATAASKTRPRF